MKKEFFEYIGPADSLNTYVRSYKLVLFKCFFELMDSTGCALAYDVSQKFKDFYMKRAENGKVPDVQVEPRIENITQSSVQDVYNVILSNPFKYITEKGFLFKKVTSEGKDQFYLPPQLVQELTSEDLQELKTIVDDKLELYYSKIDGRDNMREFVEKFTAEYVSAKQETFAGHQFGNYVRNVVPRIIYNTGIVDEEKYLVTGSVGQGNWAAVPWVCIFDRQITTSAQKGVYIVYLLSKDGRTLYLTFNQGCTEISQQHSKRETIEIMRNKAEKIAAKINSRGFLSDQNASLGEGLTQLAEFYEKGIIFYKAYNSGSVPPEEEIRNDLKNMMDIYKEYASGERTKSNDNLVKENISDFIFSKKVDQSLLKAGTTIPQEKCDVLLSKLGISLEKGEKKEVEIKVDGTFYPVILTHVKFSEKYSDRDTYQIRYSEKSDIAKKLRMIFEYSTSLMDKEMLSTQKTEKDEYIELYVIGDSKIEFRCYPIGEKEGEKQVTTKEQVAAIESYIAAKGFNYNENLVENFYLSLKSKPFVILAGTSGTGKTRIVKLFAEAINAKLQIVPVRPDWSDSSDLFGHIDLSGNFKPGAIIDFIRDASQAPETPFILCLDEMNLARVEYYMSDILSVIETREFDSGNKITSKPLICESDCRCSNGVNNYGEIKFPANLYIVGTVNMDETTFPFSKKVLDRANTIEFSYVDLLEIPSFEKIATQKQTLTNDFLVSEYITLNDCDLIDREYIKGVCSKLQRINTILESANAHVGYRVRDEIVFYMLNNKKADLLEENAAFDNQIMQKILPRIQGSSESIKNMLGELLKICENEKYEASAKKINFMIKRYEEDGFTSYWL